MPKLIWEKKLKEAEKRQQRFGWSVREKRGKVLEVGLKSTKTSQIAP